MKNRYKVADISFDVILPDKEDFSVMLPSFVPFCSTGGDCGFVIDATAEPFIPQDAEIFASESNDMGCTTMYRSPSASGYSAILELDGAKAVLHMDPDFTQAEASLDFRCPQASCLLTSLIRIMFAMAAVRFDAVSVHSSTVIREGKGYMFMGTSGTGKSTHSKQWMKAFPGTELLNDDNPIIRIVDGRLIVFGSPWSGKTPCYRNLSAPVGGIVRLEQSPENRYCALEDVHAFVDIYKGCSVLRSDDRMHDRLCDILGEAVEMVPVGHLLCRPDIEAAKVCLKGFDNFNNHD